MAIIICVDIGNRNVKTGYFNYEGLLFVEDGFPKEDELRKAEVLIYSSVSDKKLKNLQSLLESASFSGKVLRVKPQATGLKVSYKKPEQLGDDRTAFAFHIWKKLGHGLGIDAGTFINIEWVSGGTHYPLVIFPGIKILQECFKKGERLKDLEFNQLFFTGHAKFGFPNFSFSLMNSWIPHSSEECMGLGLLLSLKGLINEVVAMTKETNVIFTGGDGLFLKKLLGDNGVYEKDAVLLGLYEYYTASVQDSKL